MNVFLNTSTIVPIDALVRTLLAHSEVVTLLGLLDPIDWVIELDGAVTRFQFLLLHLVRVKPSLDDV